MRSVKTISAVLLGLASVILSADSAYSEPSPTPPATQPVRALSAPIRPYPTQRPDAAKPLDFKVTSIDGDERDLRAWDGYVILVVNVASKCGLTPQYAELQQLYDRYHDHKFIILAFPANDFAHQEPGTDEQIKAFATGKYGVTFPMMSKISVKGDQQHPLYKYLTEKATGGDFAGPVEWNFAKFLIDRDGKATGRFPARLKPLDPKVLSAIETALGLTPEQIEKLPPLAKPAKPPAEATSTTRPAGS